MTFRLPDALAQQDDAAALGLLHRYHGEPFGSSPFTGAMFDVWDSTGTRAGDADRFTADDLVAVTFLSVDTPGPAAIHVLRDRTDEFNALLAEIGPDRDMADETGPITRDWPAWRLNTRLRDLDDVGPVIASKLLARKRPRLLPIWDTVVAKVTANRNRSVGAAPVGACRPRPGAAPAAAGAAGGRRPARAGERAPGV